MHNTAGTALGPAAATTSIGVDPVGLEFLGFPGTSTVPAASALLRPLLDAVWPESDDRLVRLRRAVALWLSCSPFPTIGPYHAPLDAVGQFLRLEPSLSSLQITAAPSNAITATILLSPECKGVFAIGSLDGQAVIFLDELALRRASAQAMAARNPQAQPQLLLTTPWDVGMMPFAGAPGSGNPAASGNEGLFVSAHNDSGKSLTATASVLSSSSAGFSSGTNPLLRTLSLGLDGSPGTAGERMGDLLGPGPRGPPLLSQPIVSAVAAAWPGSDALARLKRRAALALAAAQDGPEGPYSMLASALGDVLHRHEPEAVAELRHPVTKTLRVKQLLHEGGPNEGGQQQQLPQQQLQAQQLQAGLVGGPAPFGAAGSAAGSSAGAASGGFLRVVKGKYDIVVVLDLPGLMRMHGRGGVVAPGTALGPGPAAGALSLSLGLAGAAPPPLLQPSRSLGGASTASSGSLHLGATQGSLLLRDPGSVMSAVGEGGVPPGLSGVSGPGVPQQGLFVFGIPGASGSGSSSGSAAAVVAASSGGPAGATGLSYGTESVTELALRAFPGSAPSSQLRRAIVLHLAGLPRRSQQWTHLGIFVASSQAHLWLNPAHRWPKLKAFVMHPDSRGVFLDVQLPGPGAAAGLVALDPAALRRAAAAGLATAITAAWPGNGPLERIRRAAAFTLAFAVRGPAGPYTMLGSALGTAIRKRDKEAFDALAGMGKLSELLDDSAPAGGHVGGAVVGAAAPAAGQGHLAGAAASTGPLGSTAAASGATGTTATAGDAPVSAGGAALATAAAAPGEDPAGPSGAAAGVSGAGRPRSSTGSGAPFGAAGGRASIEGEGEGGEHLAAGQAAQAAHHGAGVRSEAVGAGNCVGRGAGGGGGGGGYIVSFKKDQDGYMRLRLEALLQDFPRDDGASAVDAAAGVAAAGAGAGAAAGAVGPSSISVARPSGPIGGIGAGIGIGASNPTDASVGASSSGAAGSSETPDQSSNLLQFPATATAHVTPTGPTNSGAPLLQTAASGGAAAAALAADGGSPSPPLEQELLRRFPPPPDAPPGSDAATVAAAKRCIARLLAWAPPPHQLTFAKLGAQVPKLLGGARIGRNLRLVCLEEPDVFVVQSQSPTVHVVRLVCPRLLQLAHEQAERKAHGTPPGPGSLAPGAPHSQTPLLAQAIYHHAPGTQQGGGGAAGPLLGTSQPQLHPHQQQPQPQQPPPPPHLRALNPQLSQPQPQGMFNNLPHPFAQHQQHQQLPQLQSVNLRVQEQLQHQHQGHQQQQQPLVVQVPGGAAGAPQQGASGSAGPVALPLQAATASGLRPQPPQQPLLLRPLGDREGSELVLQQGAPPPPQGHQSVVQLVQAAGAAEAGVGWPRPPPQRAPSTLQEQQQQQQQQQLQQQQQQQRQHQQQHQQQQRQLLLFQTEQVCVDGVDGGGGGGGMPPSLRQNLSGRLVAATPGIVGGVQQGLYADRLPMTTSAPLPSSLVSGAGADGFGGRTLGASLWHSISASAAPGSNQTSQQQQQQQQQHAAQQLQAQQQQQQQQRAAAAQRLQDFAAAALVSEQALQSQAAATVSGTAGASGAPLLPSMTVHVLSDPYSADFLAVLQHCHACAQVGISVQVCDGQPALVSLYAPSVSVGVAGSAAGGAVAATAAALGGETWSPAVYVLDCTASAGGHAPEALVGALLSGLRGLLEDPGVAKVVHGCEQVRALEVASGASIAPLLDTRVLLDAISNLLPPLPPPPSPAAVAAAMTAPLPAANYSPAEATAIAQLGAHIGALRAALQSVEVWAERPELVGVLAGLHFAAHRAELWAAVGRDSTWLSRPLTEGQLAVAAQSVYNLPEIWAALCDAVPWLAAHAALRYMQHLRSLPHAAALPLTGMAAGSAATVAAAAALRGQGQGPG